VQKNIQTKGYAAVLLWLWADKDEAVKRFEWR